MRHETSKPSEVPMNLLITWSKPLSKTVALALHGWLPTVLPGIDPWMSSKDISKGKDWFRELQSVLSKIRVCLICVTPDNVRSPWIYYEVGAIASKDPDVLVCPYLVGVSPSMLCDGPLGKWQCTVADEDDTWELIKSLNANALSSRHELSLLEGNYRANWPKLFEEIEPAFSSEVDNDEGFIQTDADQVAGVSLSAEARTLLVEASQDRHGFILYLQGHDSFQTNGKDLCQDKSARSVVRWKSALDTLLSYGFLEKRGYKGEVFALTDRGFEVADLLRLETGSINRKLSTPNAIAILKEINDQGNIIAIEPSLQGVSYGIDPYHLAQKLDIPIDESLYFIDCFKEQDFLEYTMDDVLCGVSSKGRAYLFERGFLSSDTHINNPDLFPVLNETALKKHIIKKISNTPFKEIISKISLYESNVPGFKYQLIVEAPKHHKGFSKIEENWDMESPFEDDFSDIYREEPKGDYKTEWSCSVTDLAPQLQDSFVVKLDRWVLYRKTT